MNAAVTMQAFYNTGKVTFKDIDLEKLTEIINKSKEINRLYSFEEFKKEKADRYLRIMEMINSNYRRINQDTYNINSNYVTTSMAEKFLLFMFSVDPNFEAAIIYGSEDRTIDAKAKLKEKFGVYDINLIKIEKLVIRKFLSEKKRNQINKEIERRAFK